MADSVPGGTSNVPGGALRLADDLVISRMGFGAMQLAGPGVFGPPRDRDQALAVLREAVDSGVTHIDTSDFYGPVTVNELIREALHPYPADLRIVTKVGARRGEDGSWRSSLEPDDLVAQVRENLAHLGVDALDAVNLRLRAEDPGPAQLHGTEAHAADDEIIGEPEGAAGSRADAAGNRAGAGNAVSHVQELHLQRCGCSLILARIIVQPQRCSWFNVE